MGDKLTLILDAGSDSAVSYLRLKGATLDKTTTVAVADDPGDLILWGMIGFPTFDGDSLNNHAIDLLMSEKELVLAPVTSEWISKYPMLWGSVEDVHAVPGGALQGVTDYGLVQDKLQLTALLQCAKFKSGEILPHMGDVVVRGREGVLPSREILSDNGQLVTRYVPKAVPIVVDYRAGTLSTVFLPRLSHRQIDGRDTVCSLIGKRHALYDKVARFCDDILKYLGLQGVGHIQLLWDGKTLYFVDLAMHISKAVWLNMSLQNNLFLSYGDGWLLDFDSLLVSTQVGAGRDLVWGI